MQALGVQFPTANKGTLDLSSWNLKEKGKIEVRGEWKFFPNKFVNPEDDLESLFKNKTVIKFPGLWNKIKDPGNPKKQFGPVGYGSFLLKVKGLPKSTKMGLAIKRFFSSYEVFAINGKNIQKIGGMGKVGSVKNSSVAKHGPWESHFNSPSKFENSFFILIHSSNYRHRGGGLRDGMFLGLEEDIKSYIKNEEAIQFLLIGIFTIIGLYHLNLFNQRHEDNVSLWLGLTLLSLGSRLFFNNSYLNGFLESSGNLQFLWIRRLEFMSVFFLLPSLIGYTKHLFPTFMPKKFLKINLLVSLLAVIFIAFTEPITFFITLPLMWGQSVLCMIMVIYVVTRESFNKTDYSITFLVSFIICLIGAIQSALVTQHILPPPELFPITGTIFVFIQSSILSKKFSLAFRTAEKLSKNLFDEVNIRTKEAVDQKNRALASEKEVKDLLNNMKQSVFSVNEKGVIIPPVSKFSQDLFEKSIEGQSVFDTLFKNYEKNGEFLDSFRFFLNVSIGSDDLQFIMLRDTLPKKIHLSKEKRDQLSLKVGYAPIMNDSSKISKIMLVVEDVTELEKKEKEAKEQEVKSLIKVKRLQEIVSNDKKELNIFLGEMNLHIRQVKNALIDKDLDAFFRTLHTLKGSSRAYGLSGLSSEIHLLENRIVQLKKDPSTEEEDSKVLKSIHDDLEKETKNYASLIEEVYGKDVVEKVMNDENDYIKLPKERFEKIVVELTEKLALDNDFELLRKIKELENERLKEILMNLRKVVDKVSFSLNKKIELKVLGDEVFFDSKGTSILKDSILHIIQNSCDHGIEKEGKISIVIKDESDWVKVKIQDNGKGMDPENILRKAIEKGVISLKESSDLTKADKLSLIMEAGFSTKVVTTEYSGRGVGMDVVKKNIESLGGLIALDSEVNKGTTITLSLPNNKKQAA